MFALARLGLVEPDATFFFMFVNIGILYFILKKFLFVPVTNFMEKRKQGIENTINEAKRKVKEAEEYKATDLEKISQDDAESKQIDDKAITNAKDNADNNVNTDKK